MKFPSFEHFAVGARDFFSRLGIVFEPATEERRNCESIPKPTKYFSGHVGERNRTQQSVTIGKAKNRWLLFAISIAKEMAVDCSTLNLYLKHMQDSCGGLSAIVLFHYENKNIWVRTQWKYIVKLYCRCTKSGSTKSALIPHISLILSFTRTYSALEYIRTNTKNIHRVL